MLSIELDPTQLDLKEEAHKNIAEILDDIKRRASEAGVEATLTESPDGKIKYEVILPDRKITLIQETTAEGVTTQMKVELVAEPLLEVWDEGASVNMDKKGRFFMPAKIRKSFEFKPEQTIYLYTKINDPSTMIYSLEPVKRPVGYKGPMVKQIDSSDRISSVPRSFLDHTGESRITVYPCVRFIVVRKSSDPEPDEETLKAFC